MTLARIIVSEMDRLALSIVSVDSYDDEGNLNIPHFDLMSAILHEAYERGLDIRGSMYRGSTKPHGHERDYDGYEPKEGETYFL